MYIKALMKLIIATLLITLNFSSIIAQSTANLDGNAYAITLTKVSGKKGGFRWKSDTFKFNSGEMISVILGEREGFGSESYAPAQLKTDAAQTISFTYKSTNKYGSKLQIEGKVDGNFMEGTAIWTNGKGNHTYTFKGILI